MRTRIYSLFLALYPAELRNTFRAEMIQVFGEDLEDSYGTHGFLGAATVWCRSLKELFLVALPARAAQREVAVALLMYVLQEVYCGAFLLLAHRDPSGPVTPNSIGQLIAFTIVFPLFPAVIAFVALRIGDRAVPVPLKLGPR